MLETIVAVSILAIASALVLLTPYRDYARSRAAADAAATLAQDLALLERVAQNGGANDGATLAIVSSSPLVYECHYGRPHDLDPNSVLGPIIVRRAFEGVALVGGPIDPNTPLLFASNGSAQYVLAGNWAEQHQTIELTLAPATGSRGARVRLNLFTGAISVP
jgi:type II secretory pathway pseudopilin PulG